MRIVVIGKNGQLASELAASTPADVSPVCLGRTDINLASKDDILEKISKETPDVVINASAYTAVDKAEADIDSAFELNATAVQNLVGVCKELQCRFIHISTDFVFDGTKNIAYEPNDPTNPLGVYGASKLAGEVAVLQSQYSNATIVRTSWVYSVFGNNFVKTMLRLIKEKDKLGIVSDQIGTPTSASGLATFLWTLSRIDKLEPIYHWSDSGIASWYDFAVAIQELSLEIGLLEAKIPLLPIASAEYPTPAKRPCFSVLNTSMSAKLVSQQHWRQALRQTLYNLKLGV